MVWFGASLIALLCIGSVPYFVNGHSSENIDSGDGVYGRSLHDNLFEKSPEFSKEIRFTMPPEEYPHEGTWIYWPHNFGWDYRHVKRYEETWVQMTIALHPGEIVHIVVYDYIEEELVWDLLESRGVNMKQIDFMIAETDDVWARDSGGIFVFDENDKMHVTNWGFNGWGEKTYYEFDDLIPEYMGEHIGVPVIDVTSMINEGGSIEVDGRGTLMAKRSSILNRNRNPGWTQADAEIYFKRYLGVTNFIWLDGTKRLDLTDDHIDGTARFANGDTIVTMARSDFVVKKEYDELVNAVDVNGDRYEIVHLPLTKNKVRGANDYGVYVNFYVGNEVVLVPFYNDPNDSVAAEILQDVYPTREIVGIDFREAYKDGGAVHCVTQQQPMAAPAAE